MKTPTLLILLCVAATTEAQPTAPPPPLSSQTSDYIVTDRGPHHKLWTRNETITLPNGRQINRHHRYTELAAGMHVSRNGAWIEASPSFQLTADGFAIATNCQHSVFVSPDLADPNGVVDLVDAAGNHFRSVVLGIVLSDPSIGTNVQVASVRADATGIQTAPNEITFLDAFNGLRANLRIRNERGAFHQDVVLLQKVTAQQLAQLGLSPASTRVEIWTEFLESPVPVGATTASASRQTIGDDPEATPAPGETSNDVLTLGATTMEPGVAFLDSDRNQTVPVQKRWVEDSDRRALVESAVYTDLAPLLEQLPDSDLTASHSKPQKGMLARTTSTTGTSTISSKTAPRRLIRIARLDPVHTPNPNPALTMDYSQLTGTLTNVVFLGDSTTYIPSALALAGSNVWEPGAIIKFASNASISIVPMPGTTPVAEVRGRDYAPVVFTAKDDNSAGENISGSTGTPTGYYANGALQFATSGSVTSARFLYAKQAVGASGANIPLNDCQFVNCQVGLALAGAYVPIRNALFANVGTNLLSSGGTTVTVENGTFANSTWLATAPTSPSGSSLSLTNCIFANVTNLTNGVFALCADYNAFYQSPSYGSHIVGNSSSWPFQTVGGGSYYLADNSPFRNAGTLTISSNLLADLNRRTTYPPILSAWATLPNTDVTLSPQAQRDTDVVDLGWHYSALDYEFGGVRNTNQINVTVAPGTAVGCFGYGSTGYGLWLAYGATLTAQGTPTAPVRFVEYNTVQEFAPPTFYKPYYSMLISTYAPMNFRFAELSVLDPDVWLFACNGVTPGLQDSFIHAGQLVTFYDTGFNLTNCVLERVYADIEPGDSSTPMFRNNTVFGGSLCYFPNVAPIMRDNIFDHTALPCEPFSYVGGFNAFVAGCNRLDPTNATDIILPSSPAYQTGRLGNYYLPLTSQLINADTNITADQVCLYHYTTTTNLISGGQIKEPNSFLDIGYHSVAINSASQSIDTDGDGLIDVFEDLNGNGTTQAGGGETDWQVYTFRGDLKAPPILEVFTPLK